MRCSHVQSQLSAYADGELNAVQSQRVAAHVAGCAECAGEYELLRSVISMAALVPEEESPAGLRERILLAARSLEHQPRPSMWQQVRARAMPARPVWAGAFAASVALVGVASVWRPAEKIVASTVPPPHQPASADNTARPPAPAAEPRREAAPPREPVKVAGVTQPRPEVTQPAPVADVKPEAPAKPSPAVGPETRPAVHAARPKNAPATLAPSVLATGPVGEPKLSQPPAPPQPVETPGAPVMANVTPVPGVLGPEPLVNDTKPGKMMVSAPSGPEEGTAEDEDILLKLKRELRDRNLMVPQPPLEEISKPGRRMRG